MKSDKQKLKLIERLTSKAVSFVNNTIRKEVDASIEEQEKAIHLIQDEEYEQAVEILSDNIQFMMERKEMWKTHAERLGDQEANALKKESLSLIDHLKEEGVIND